MIRDRKVTVIFNEQRMPAVVLMGSDNRLSIMIEVDKFAFCVAFGRELVTVPMLLISKDGQHYEEVLGGAPFEVEWPQ